MRVKLVRDNLPALPGEHISFANSEAGKAALLVLKLHEETQEIAADPTNPAEYGDVLEALFELARMNKVSIPSILRAMEYKREKSGGFRRGRVLIAE